LELCLKIRYEYLDKTPAMIAAVTGLIIQFEISKTMLDT
jgi:hypothetical protein